MSFLEFEKGLPGTTFQQARQQEKEDLERAKHLTMLARFKESERVLNILRPIPAVKDQEEDLMRKWLKTATHN